jgi:hypothetical protein
MVAVAEAQFAQQNASSPRETIDVSTTIGTSQCAQRRLPVCERDRRSVPEPCCSIAAEQLEQQNVISPWTTWVVGSEMDTSQLAH